MLRPWPGLWALLLLFSTSSLWAAGGIVSINLCLDQMLLRFAEREKIASVTYFADNPQMSPLAGQAEGLHRNHGLVEEIIPLQPELILAGEYGAREASELLTTLGFTVIRVPLPYNLDDIDAHLLRMGEILGQPERLARHLLQWRQRKAQLRRANENIPMAQRPSVLMLGPNQIAPGFGTLEDELLTLAGFRNWAALQNLEGFSSINFEHLVLNPPDILIVGKISERDFSLAHEVLQHPALVRAMAHGTIAALPSNLAVCPAPNINELLSSLLTLRVQSNPKEIQ